MAGLTEFLNSVTRRHTVEKASSRWASGMLVVLCLAAIVSGELWMMALLAYDAAVRTVGLPLLSPFAFFASRIVLPALRVQSVTLTRDSSRAAGAMALALSLASLALYFGLHSATPYRGCLGALTLIAAVETIYGLRASDLLLAAWRRAGSRES